MAVSSVLEGLALNHSESTGISLAEKTVLSDFEHYLSNASVDLDRVAQDDHSGVSWSVARFDKLDNGLSGNKAFKLLPQLIRAHRAGVTTLLSFGGWHSNHLHALARAGVQFGFGTVGLVRGYADQPLSPTLLDAKAMGMTLVFVNKTDYRQRYDLNYQQSMLDKWPGAMLIQEGGAGGMGVEGARLMAGVLSRSLASVPDYVFLPAGTATTLAGFATAPRFCASNIIGVAAVKDVENMRERVRQAQECCTEAAMCEGAGPRWRIDDNYTFGGFAKITPPLARFIKTFEQTHGIPLDPVYNAKTAFAIHSMMNDGQIAAGSHVVQIHTGGLQGRRAMQDKLDKLCRVDDQLSHTHQG